MKHVFHSTPTRMRNIQVSMTSLTRYITSLYCAIMDLSPIRQNFEKNRNGQKYHHSLKEHPTFTKIVKFGCEML